MTTPITFISENLNTNPASTFTVTINPVYKAIDAKPIHFNCTTNQSILDAAIAAGINLPYGCKNGACGSCKVLFNQGNIQHSYDNSTVKLAQSEGSILLCCAKLSSDIVITAHVSPLNTAYPVKKLPSRIINITRISEDIAIIKLQLPLAETIQFKAGQYLEIILKDGSRRAYSIATAPHQLTHSPINQIELHIRHMPGGLFTDALFEIAGSQLPFFKEKDIIRIEIPQGTFYLRDADQDKPNQAMIMLASGTGFAPIQSIIEHSLAIQSTRPIHLYWGGRQLKDLYAHELALSWEKQYAHIHYVPVLSESTTDSNWHGRTGLVHQAVVNDYPNLSQYQVYACGSPIMVSRAQSTFTTDCKLPIEAFFADSFTSKADSLT